MTNEAMNMVNNIVKAYIEVYGADKWNGFTDQEKHDVIMIIVKDMTKAIGE